MVKKVHVILFSSYMSYLKDIYYSLLLKCKFFSRKLFFQLFCFFMFFIHHGSRTFSNYDHFVKRSIKHNRVLFQLFIELLTLKLLIWKIILKLKYFQTCMACFLLQNTNADNLEFCFHVYIVTNTVLLPTFFKISEFCIIGWIIYLIQVSI